MRFWYRFSMQAFQKAVLVSCLVAIVAALGLVGCGGATGGATDVASQSPNGSQAGAGQSQNGTVTGAGGQSSATCPPPTFFPAQLWLSYPIPGATNVSVSIGKIILANTGGSGPFTVTMTSPNADVPVGTPTRAPTPLPTPYATPGPNTQSNMTEYLAVPIPTLSPSTTYTVTASIQNGVSTSQCADITTQSLGNFTTM